MCKDFYRKIMKDQNHEESMTHSQFHGGRCDVKCRFSNWENGFSGVQIYQCLKKRKINLNDVLKLVY